MSEVQDENQDGAGFTAPPSVKEGAAELPKKGGVATQKSVSKDAVKAVKKVVRDVKVVAIAKGWFDCKRIEPGKKFSVSKEEFSENWMQKI